MAYWPAPKTVTLAIPLDAGHLVIDVNIGIVGQEDVVIGAFGGVKGEHDQR